jgi:hypothetical protein
MEGLLEMKIIRLKGGLGNQLFQYAFFHSLREKYGNEVYVDLGFFVYFSKSRQYELDLAFKLNLELNQAAKADVLHLANTNYSFAGRILLKVFGYKKTHLCDSEMGYISISSSSSDVYFDGYWHSFK